MKNRIQRSIIPACAVAAAVLISGGCGAVKREPLEVSYFLMQPQFASQEPSAAEAACLIIRSVSAPPLYRESQLVYRTGDVEFDTDYYNRFMTSPPSQLTRAIHQWADALGWAICPEETAESRTEQYILRPMLETLYGDFRNKSKPAAVVEMQFTLTHTDPTCQCARVLLSKLYSERVDLEASSPAALVRAQGRAVENILQQLRADLAAVLPQ
jgi:cholesterol transport system auxiliary component